MAGEEYKALASRIYTEIFNAGNFEVATEIFSPDFVDHFPDPLPNQPIRSPEAVIWYAKTMRAAFPDLTATVESIIVEGDELASRVTWRGTHVHQLVFLPPTGRHIIVSGIDWTRIAGGKIAEHWGGWNLATLMHQLGIWPVPEGTIG